MLEFGNLDKGERKNESCNNYRNNEDVEKTLRGGLFAVGAVILIVGIVIIANDQPRVSAVESMFGGWAMLSPEYQSIVQELMFGYVLAVFGIVLIIAGAIAPSKSEEDEETDTNSIDILKERYAKGEITKEEFDKMKEDLT